MAELAADGHEGVVNGLHQVLVDGRTSYGATVAIGFVVAVGAVVSVIYVLTHRPRGEALPAYLCAAGALILDATVIWRLLNGPAPRFGSWGHYSSFLAGFTLVNLSVAARMYRWRLLRYG